MKTVTLLNEKGGVGKTTLATHIAMHEAAHGKRVLLVDADPQGHATLRCGVSKAPKFYDLMVRDANWEDVTTKISPDIYDLPDKVSGGELYVVPSNVETRNIAGSIDNVAMLAMRLDELRDMGTIDLVVIDTSPTPSLLHASIYVATDGVIFPTELAFTSFDGMVEGIKHKMGADAGRNRNWGLPEIKVIGIVPIKTRLHTLEQKDNMEKLKTQFGAKVLPELPLRTLWTETESRALPVWQLDANHEATHDFLSVMKALEGELVYG